MLLPFWLVDACNRKRGILFVSRVQDCAVCGAAEWRVQLSDRALKPPRPRLVDERSERSGRSDPRPLPASSRPPRGPPRELCREPRSPWRRGLLRLREPRGRGSSLASSIPGISIRIIGLLLMYSGGYRGSDRKSTRLNSSHSGESRMPSSA